MNYEKFSEGSILLYEGKAKKVYRTADPQEYRVVFKDDATAFNGEKKGMIKGKGQMNCLISSLLFEELEAAGIPTHFIQLNSPGEMIVKAVSIIPVEVIVRNAASHTLERRLGCRKESSFLTRCWNFVIKMMPWAIQW